MTEYNKEISKEMKEKHKKFMESAKLFSIWFEGYIKNKAYPKKKLMYFLNEIEDTCFDGKAKTYSWAF